MEPPTPRLARPHGVTGSSPLGVPVRSQRLEGEGPAWGWAGGRGQSPGSEPGGTVRGVSRAVWILGSLPRRWVRGAPSKRVGPQTHHSHRRCGCYVPKTSPARFPRSRPGTPAPSADTQPRRASSRAQHTGRVPCARSRRVIRSRCSRFRWQRGRGRRRGWGRWRREEGSHTWSLGGLRPRGKEDGPGSAGTGHGRPAWVWCWGRGPWPHPHLLGPDDHSPARENFPAGSPVCA